MWHPNAAFDYNVIEPPVVTIKSFLSISSVRSQGIVCGVSAQRFA